MRRHFFLDGRGTNDLRPSHLDHAGPMRVLQIPFADSHFAKLVVLSFIDPHKMPPSGYLIACGVELRDEHSSVVFAPCAAADLKASKVSVPESLHLADKPVVEK